MLKPPAQCLAGRTPRALGYTRSQRRSRRATINQSLVETSSRGPPRTKGSRPRVSTQILLASLWFRVSGNSGNMTRQRVVRGDARKHRARRSLRGRAILSGQTSRRKVRAAGAAKFGARAAPGRSPAHASKQGACATTVRRIRASRCSRRPSAATPRPVSESPLAQGAYSDAETHAQP